MRLDKFLVAVEEPKRERKSEEKGIVVPMIFRDFIKYLIKVDGRYIHDLNISISGSVLRAVYLSSDRVWMSVLEAEVKNCSNIDAKFRIFDCDLSTILKLTEVSRIIKMDVNHDVLTVNGKEFKVELDVDDFCLREPQISDEKFTEKIVLIDVDESSKLLREIGKMTYTVMLTAKNGVLEVAWEEYDGQICTTTLRSHVREAKGVTVCFDPTRLSKILNNPFTNRILIEYGEDLPMKITFSRNVRCWIAPKSCE